MSGLGRGAGNKIWSSNNNNQYEETTSTTTTPMGNNRKKYSNPTSGGGGNTNMNKRDSKKFGQDSVIGTSKQIIDYEEEHVQADGTGNTGGSYHHYNQIKS